MAALVSSKVADHRLAKKCHVAHRIQDFVAHELVGKPQPIRIQNGEVVHHDGVFQRAAAGQALLLERLYFPEKPERARASNLPSEGAIRELHLEELIGDQRMAEIDPAGDLESIARVQSSSLVAVADRYLFLDDD